MLLHITILENNTGRPNPKTFLHFKEKVTLVVIQKNNRDIGEAPWLLLVPLKQVHSLIHHPAFPCQPYGKAELQKISLAGKPVKLPWPGTTRYCPAVTPSLAPGSVWGYSSVQLSARTLSAEGRQVISFFSNWTGQLRDHMGWSERLYQWKHTSLSLRDTWCLIVQL